MDLVNSTVLVAHSAMRWLAVAVGGIAVACLVGALAGRPATVVWARRATALFGVTIAAQALLGVTLFALMAALNHAPFEGRAGTQIGHSLGGVLMAVCASLSVLTLNRLPRTRLQLPIALVLSGSTVLMLGKLVVSGPVALASLLVVTFLSRRQQPREPSQTQ